MSIAQVATLGQLLAETPVEGVLVTGDGLVPGAIVCSLLNGKEAVATYTILLDGSITS